MIVVGADVHKRSHTLVAVDGAGRKLGEKVVEATSVGDAAGLHWVRAEFGADAVWGVEDCRAVLARLERELLDAGNETADRSA